MDTVDDIFITLKVVNNLGSAPVTSFPRGIARAILNSKNRLKGRPYAKRNTDESLEVRARMTKIRCERCKELLKENIRMIRDD